MTQRRQAIFQNFSIDMFDNSSTMAGEVFTEREKPGNVSETKSL